MKLTIAAPSKEDFDATYQFMRIMEALTDNRAYRSADESDWLEWSDDEDDEDGDYTVLKRVYDSMIGDYEEFSDEDDVDHRIVLWQYVKNYFNHNPSALGRIIMCADAAMENAFDKDSDDLSWKHEISEKVNKYDEIVKKLDELNRDEFCNREMQYVIDELQKIIDRKDEDE